MRLDQRRLSRVVRGNILRQALHFGVERSQGGMGVARQFAFARPVLGEPRLLRRQIVEPLPRGTFLALQSDKRRGRLGERIALCLRLGARATDARRCLLYTSRCV